jgi:peptidoglycan hydrolase-like protein with peptidoglycan-binding domain
MMAKEASMRRSIKLTMVALLIGGSATFALASPASAATPQCTGEVDATFGASSGTVPAVNGSTNCIMGPGSNSSGVTSLQVSLSLCNGQNISVDGIYGPQTTQAVRNVQSNHGIPVDGVYGPQTRGVMLWALFNDIGRKTCQPYSALHIV